MAGALHGIRVIDFGQYIAGPLAGMMLADQGAEVIRVERPDGPAFQTPANQTWNRGKRSIVLNLKEDADRETAERLILHADVVIENFRPGVMDRLGLGAQEMLAANPELIYCSLPGFAGDDPRAGLPAWEGVLDAATATAGRADLATPAANGSSFRPVYSAIPAHSTFAALLGAVSIAMALNARARDGAGQRIEVPLFDATFTALGFRAQQIHASGDSAAASDIRAAMGRGFGGVPLAGTHRCKDGRWIYVHPGNKNYVDFVRAIGANQFAGKDDAADLVRELFLTRTAQEWEDLGEEVATEIVACRTTPEWMATEQAQGSSMLAHVEDVQLGAMVQPGVQVHLTAAEGSVTPAPSADSDRADVLAIADQTVIRSPGFDTSAMPLAALAGKKVLDLCIVLAGPTCGRTLAEFGANVIKIERPPAPGKDGTRKLPLATPHSFNIDINRGKRSLALDLKTPEGVEVFRELVRDADVVVQNFRLGIDEKLGYSYEQIREINPRIVYASLNMYGYDGPWAGRPGHEQLAQMGTGMSVRYAGDGEPLLQHAGALNDYGTGLIGAFGVALALYHRERTGQGQRVWSSLAHTGQLLQSRYFYDYPGRGEWDEPSGQDAWGESALQRFYGTRDGWVFLGATAEQESILAGLEGFSAFPEGGDDAGIARFLEARLVTEDSKTWCARLQAAGIGIHALVKLEDLMADPWVREHNLIVSMDYPNIGRVDQAGPPPRLSRTPVVAGCPAPATGADGRAILEEHGLDADALAAVGAVVV